MRSIIYIYMLSEHLNSKHNFHSEKDTVTSKTEYTNNREGERKEREIEESLCDVQF